MVGKATASFVRCCDFGVNLATCVVGLLPNPNHRQRLKLILHRKRILTRLQLILLESRDMSIVWGLWLLIEEKLAGTQMSSLKLT